VRRGISRMDSSSRSAQRLMTLSVATSITPTAPCHIKQQVRVLAWVSFTVNGNHSGYGITSGWKSTRTVLDKIAAAFEQFNEVHPHSSLKMRSPREFRRHRAEQMRHAQLEQPALHFE
jgi:hypothetical protein